MHIARYKKDFIRRRYIEGKLNVSDIANVLKLENKTVRFYINEFRIIETEYPDKLRDYSFFIGNDKVTKATPWYQNLIKVLPDLVAKEDGPLLVGAKLYRKYEQLYPDQYSSARFYPLFRRWFDENKDQICAAKLQTKFTKKELETLKNWRRSNDHRLWQVAVTLMTVYTYHSLGSIANQIECSYKTLLDRLRSYKAHGLEGIDRPGSKKPIKAARAIEIKNKMTNLVHLVRQPPKLYGIDRSCWCITDLAFVFSREFGQNISPTTVSLYLKRSGVRYKRSREVIVSTDPLFREKYRQIQDILGSLADNEKFFSIDEYGPCSVRPKSGRQLAIKGSQPVYQKVDKGKGWFICTCALELSSNQLTWFYSKNKDTNEMIRLIELLVAQYKRQEKLFLSWDAASWHASEKLLSYLEEINQPIYRSIHQTPMIILAPLPARSPHLNVIESVFSGMSKSVIRNSDYETVAACRTAIDRYFLKRNQFYLDNPKRAGNKIWGKEKVIPVFDKANICKNL